MKVKLLRDVRPFGRTGETVEVSPDRSEWLLTLGMAVKVEEAGEQAEKPETAEKVTDAGEQAEEPKVKKTAKAEKRKQK